MRVWVTRTRPGADRTAERLRALGHEPVVQPVLSVQPLTPDLDLTGVGALAFTSAHGVAVFAVLNGNRGLPVFAVGGATAAAAGSAGFTDVRSAEGDIGALARLIAADPPRGVVLHAAGTPRAGDLEADLRAGGVAARTAVLYRTDPVEAAAPEQIDAVLVHSPHAARVLAAVLSNRSRPLFCLSRAVTVPLLARGFIAVTAAARPDEDALLALLPPATACARTDLGTRREDG